MKKTFFIIMIIALALSFTLLLTACTGGDETPEEPKITVDGKYEMTSISGSVTVGTTTVELEEGLYEYYRMTLNLDGTALIEAKGATQNGVEGAKIEREATWEYDVENGILKIMSKEGSLTVVEEMQWAEGVITYETEQTAQGMTMKMTLILEKVTEPAE